jgi:hypothetical protein
MRRNIFSSSSIIVSGDNIPPVAVAGQDLFLEDGDSIELSGSGSYDVDGSIVTYLWSNPNAESYTITTPNTVATTITGAATGSSYLIRLTVTDDQGDSHSDDVYVHIDVVGSQKISIRSSVPLANGTGTIEIKGSQPYEVVDLSFSLSGGDSGDESMDFSGWNQGVLDSSHTSRSGSVSLSSAGYASVNYSSTGTDFMVVVTITDRSSNESMPTPEPSTAVTIPA